MTTGWTYAAAPPTSSAADVAGPDVVRSVRRLSRDLVRGRMSLALTSSAADAALAANSSAADTTSATNVVRPPPPLRPRGRRRGHEVASPNIVHRGAPPTSSAADVAWPRRRPQRTAHTSSNDVTRH